MNIRSLAFALFVSTASLVPALFADVPATQPMQIAPAKSDDFLRFVDRGTAGSKLETADVAYRNAAGVTVHLVAAIHVAEPDYYESLNQSFKLRDAVLYEMVKPKDAGVPRPGQPSSSMIGQVQHLMKDLLSLDFQLDDVNYSAANFVHADLDAETFEKMQGDRGESFAMMFVQQIFKAMQQPHDEPAQTADQTDAQLEDMVRMFTRPDATRQMKLRLAKQLADMENSPMGPVAMQGTVLVTERNKAAFSVLDREISNGKRDIAIFYGAAHMPDMAARLQAMGFSQIATEWRTAWDLTIRGDEPSAIETLLIGAIKELAADGR